MLARYLSQILLLLLTFVICGYILLDFALLHYASRIYPYPIFHNQQKHTDIPEPLVQAIIASQGDDFLRTSFLHPRPISRHIARELLEDSGKRQGDVNTQVPVLSYKIDQSLRLEEILDMYIHSVYLGHGLYGFPAASKTYFAKELHALNLAEIVTLASIIKYPNYFNPLSHPEKNKTRRQHILKRMFEKNMITQEQFLTALEMPITVKNHHKTYVVP